MHKYWTSPSDKPSALGAAASEMPPNVHWASSSAVEVIQISKGSHVDTALGFWPGLEHDIVRKTIAFTDPERTRVMKWTMGTIKYRWNWTSGRFSLARVVAVLDDDTFDHTYVRPCEQGRCQSFKRHTLDPMRSGPGRNKQRKLHYLNEMRTSSPVVLVSSKRCYLSI